MAAYAIANYRITDSGSFKPYVAAVTPILAAYGAEVLVVDNQSEIVEGEAGHVTVVLKFPSKDAARAFYDSAEYQEIIHLRTDNTEGFLVFADEFVVPQ